MTMMRGERIEERWGIKDRRRRVNRRRVRRTMTRRIERMAKGTTIKATKIKGIITRGTTIKEIIIKGIKTKGTTIRTARNRRARRTMTTKTRRREPGQHAQLFRNNLSSRRVSHHCHH